MIKSVRILVILDCLSNFRSRDKRAPNYACRTIVKNHNHYAVCGDKSYAEARSILQNKKRKRNAIKLRYGLSRV